MKIVIDNAIPFIKGVLENYAEVVYREGKKISRKDLHDADALIIRTRTRCNAELLEGSCVRFIATATIGFDHIDTVFCEANNIRWTSAEGCNSSSVQQYVAAALFQLAKKVNFRLSGQTIGIIGVGNVGRKVATLCGALGMRVLLNDPPRERREGSKAFVSVQTILKDADIVSLHVPLNHQGQDRTFHMVDEKFTAKMQKHQMLINSSRGEVVDTIALRSALQEKKLAGGVVDVWENEPYIDPELLRLAEIGTAHIAGYSVDGKANGTSMSVQALSRFFGLGIDSWYPKNLPLPETTGIEIDCRNKHQEEVLGDLVHRTYDILADDRRLRSAPGTFERQRVDYPVRREFPVYKVRLYHADDAIESTVRKMGFGSVER